MKRIRGDVKELTRSPSPVYFALPLEDNMYEWHFCLRGAPDTDFAGGIYHGRILLPPDWPFKAPDIVLLTPNGRFETRKKICLSISSHHNETWQPAWGVRLILEAIVSFMPTPGEGALGSLDYPPAERRALAVRSHSWEGPPGYGHEAVWQWAREARTTTLDAASFSAGGARGKMAAELAQLNLGKGKGGSAGSAASVSGGEDASSLATAGAPVEASAGAGAGVGADGAAPAAPAAAPAPAPAAVAELRQRPARRPADDDGLRRTAGEAGPAGGGFDGEPRELDAALNNHESGLNVIMVVVACCLAALLLRKWLRHQGLIN